MKTVARRTSILSVNEQGARATRGYVLVIALFASMNNCVISKRKGARLPHWTRDHAIYAVTFRLADSMPQEILKQWSFEREDIPRTAASCNRLLTLEERKKLQYLYSARVQNFLDSGYGACWMKYPNIAKIVAQSITHFNNQRYTLFAWCIMPNHVHVVVQPHKDFSLSKILHSWKSYSANQINGFIGRSGPFWQIEYYDHLIRNLQNLQHAMSYAFQNPEKSGMKQWQWRWMMSWEEVERKIGLSEK